MPVITELPDFVPTTVCHIDNWEDNFIESLKSDGIYDSFMKSFAACRTDEESIALLYKQRYIKEIIKCKRDFKPKNEEKAKKLREEGNEAFRQKKYSAALSLYNQSVLLAPVSEGSTELALALANRAAVLQQQRQYVLCLQDVELALQHGYPAALQYKLLERRARCHYHLGSRGEAVSNFQGALNALQQAALDDKKRESIAADLQKQLTQVKKVMNSAAGKASAKSSASSHSPPCFHGPVPQIEGEQSHEIPCMTSGLALRECESRGRGIYATRDIFVGEVLIVEQPYAAVHVPESIESHCMHCFCRVLCPLPCPTCSAVVFCSAACRTAALKAYHEAECPYLGLILKSQVGKLTHLALRMVLQAGFSYLLDYTTRRDDRTDSLKRGFNAEGWYDSSDYHSVYNLVGHREKRSPKDLLRRSLCAFFGLQCLEAMGMVPTSRGENQALKDRIMLGGHVLRHIQMLPCNAHEISELRLNPQSFSTSMTEEVGSGIYSTLSLINHSCDPSVIRNSFGNKCVVRALRNVKQGEEIFDNYGALYPVQPLAERQALLSRQYYFTCRCQACVEDWPLYNDVPKEDPKFRCEKCDKAVKLPEDGALTRAFCTSCRHVQDLTYKIELLTRSDEAYNAVFQGVLQGEGLEQAEPILVNHLRQMDPLLCRPWRDYNDAQEALKQCYNVKANCFRMENAPQ